MHGMNQDAEVHVDLAEHYMYTFHVKASDSIMPFQLGIYPCPSQLLWLVVIKRDGYIGMRLMRIVFCNLGAMCSSTGLN